MSKFVDRDRRTTNETALVERVARALMHVTARLPGNPDGREFPVLAMDPDFDDLPLDHTQGCDEDEITQEAVLKLARAAIEAMRDPTPEMLKCSERFPWSEQFAGDAEEERAYGKYLWQAMNDAALAAPTGEKVDVDAVWHSMVERVTKT